MLTREGRRRGCDPGGLVALRAGVAILTGLWLACGDAPDPGGGPPPEVDVATARIGSLPDLREYVGNVRAVNRVELRARVRGYLTEQLFEDGARVAAGDLLFRIDPSAFEVALAEAKGELARARADAMQAERDLERAEQLLEDDAVSLSIVDQRRAERDAFAAAVDAARAAVRAAELDLSYARVRAPIAGRIGRALVDVGNLVGESGQDTVLAELVQVDPVHVYFASAERETTSVFRTADASGTANDASAEGGAPLTVRLRLGDGSTHPHEGVVDFVEPTVDATRGTVAVRARVPNPDGALRPGQFVRVSVAFPDIEDVVLVPERAVLQEQGGSYVLVVGEDDTVVRRPVRPGRGHDGIRVLLEGLEGGERVVVDGVQKARPGTEVVARPWAGETSVESGNPSGAPSGG